MYTNMDDLTNFLLQEKDKFLFSNNTQINHANPNLFHPLNKQYHHNSNSKSNTSTSSHPQKHHGANDLVQSRSRDQEDIQLEQSFILKKTSYD